MSNQETLYRFRSTLTDAMLANEVVKVSLGNYKGNDATLKNIYVRKVKIKREDKLSFTYRHKTRDIIKNFNLEDGIGLIIGLLSNDFKVCNLLCINREITVEHNKKNEISIRERGSVKTVQLSEEHNKVKKRAIGTEGKNYLKELKVTDAEGNVFKSTQDKYKQINHYIEILSTLIKEVPPGRLKKVVDMGSGKGYLTFALYDYLHNELNIDATVTGVEYREDLVVLCNGISKRSGFDELFFLQGGIAEFSDPSIDMLIALHACDTATDDAILKGIDAGASLIVVAPCCHKQVRASMTKSRSRNALSFLTKHGVFMERQAEMITDGIRALVLQYFGYKVKVMEFISDIHTPKNVLITGIKGGAISKEKKNEILEEIGQSLAFFSIDEHYLVKSARL